MDGVKRISGGLGVLGVVDRIGEHPSEACVRVLEGVLERARGGELLSVVIFTLDVSQNAGLEYNEGVDRTLLAGALFSSAVTIGGF